jgi:hypothetical protein
MDRTELYFHIFSVQLSTLDHGNKDQCFLVGVVHDFLFNHSFPLHMIEQNLDTQFLIKKKIPCGIGVHNTE